MKIFGIKECRIKKYLSGTLEGGILKLSKEEEFNLYLELMKKQYPGAYTESTPIWSYIKPSKEIKSYREFLEELKTSNPEEYNRLMESSAQSETSEVSKPWIDAKGNVRRSTNIGAGFVSGTDPVGALYVEGVATAPIFNWMSKAALYGLARAGNNWARAKILSREMRNISVPNKGISNNVGWAPRQTMKVVHASNSSEIPGLYFEKRWDVVNEGANPHGIWYQGKLGVPRTNLTNPGKGAKALKARDLFASRPYQLEGDVTFKKPMQTIGDVKNRSQLSYDADNMGADGLIYNDIYDNGYNHNLVILGWRLFVPNRNYQASIGNPVLIKEGTEYYMPNLLIDELKRGKEAAAKFFEHSVVLLSYKHNLELAKRLGISIPDRPENMGTIIRLPTKVNWTGAANNSYALVALTHLGDPDAVISYRWMPYDKKIFTLSTIHENLHRGYYSAPLKFKNISKEYYNNVYKPQYSFYKWKTEKLLKPEYHDSYLADISGGEAGPNFIDLGRDLGLKLGLKYPGYEAVKNMLLNYKGFKSWMIPLLNMSEAGMRHIWDAMTGKYFAVPLGISLMSKNVKSNN